VEKNNRLELPEPWLRGTLTEVAPVARGVLHALELAGEDLHRWCSPLSDEQLNSRPAALPPLAFHLRHIARSLDRLLSYAENRPLNDSQLAALQSELDLNATRAELFLELDAALTDAAGRVRALSTIEPATPREVGKKRLPTTVGGLLVHIADHTQRHVGQAITTAKIVKSLPAS
jgi:uncharacterized damage-inducible protein DinB